MLKSLSSIKPLEAIGEQEIKFHVPNQQSIAFKDWLDFAFEKHPTHAACTICSIYFDTPNGTSLSEKVESDYHKSKFRLRWYCDLDENPLPVPSFLEVKKKQGSARIKHRVKLPLSGADLMQMPIQSAELVDLFREYFPVAITTAPPLLRPVLELRYVRHRYTHLVYPDAFCFDTNIRSVRTHPRLLPLTQGQPLSHGVFEQKGSNVDPLPVLRALPRFDIKRQSISKYFLTILQLRPNSELS